LHQLLFFRKSLVDLLVDPPTFESSLRTTEQNPVPSVNTSFDALNGIILGSCLMFIKPAPDALCLKVVMEFYSKWSVGIAVAYKA